MINIFANPLWVAHTFAPKTYAWTILKILEQYNFIIIFVFTYLQIDRKGLKSKCKTVPGIDNILLGELKKHAVMSPKHV